MQQFQIAKDQFSKTRIVDCLSTPLDDGEVRVKVEAFSFTANNITYALVADMFGYWKFFPPVSADGEAWGVLPVWGFACVTESRCSEVAVGERIFGYFPPATELVMVPTHINASRWVDNVVHRQALPAGYNQYRRIEAGIVNDPRSEDERMLLFPLHITSYCLFDRLQTAEYFSAEQIIIVSASSKTSIGLAYGVHGDVAAPELIGLTSARNQDLVTALGCYDGVLTYDAITAIDSSKATAIIDMSGNGELMAALHRHLGDNMRQTISVGFTHWEQGAKLPGFIEERSEMFFAPGYIQVRSKDIGFDEFERRSTDYMQDTVAKSRSWLKMTDIDGLAGLREIFDTVCNGKIAADAGLIVRL